MPENDPAARRRLKFAPLATIQRAITEIQTLRHPGASRDPL
jgi:hypothetical protein